MDRIASVERGHSGRRGGGRNPRHHRRLAAGLLCLGLFSISGLGGCQRVREAIRPAATNEPTEARQVPARPISTPDAAAIAGANATQAAGAIRDLEAAIALATISALAAGGATLDAGSVATLAAIGGRGTANGGGDGLGAVLGLGDALGADLGVAPGSAPGGTLSGPGSADALAPVVGTPENRMTQEVYVRATLFAMASGTFAPTSTPTRPPSVLGRPPGASAAEPGCEIPRQPELWGMTLPSGAGAAAAEAMRAAFGAMPVPLLRGRYTGGDRVEPLVPPLGFELRIRREGPLPPLREGSDYNFAFYPAEGSDAVGQALRIDDERGPLLLAVSQRETEGAGARIWGGDRAGFSIRQIPTLCRYVEMDDCGFELRAAPVEVRRDGASVTLSPGTQGRLESDPPYDVFIVTSHARLWRGDLPCQDPSDWVLSYRIQRVDG